MVFVVCPINGNLELRKFRARTVRVMNKIVFDVRLNPALTQAPVSPLPPAVRLEDARPLPLPIRPSGPPADWVKVHDRAPGCNGCSQKSFGKRQHNAECKRRYKTWVESQQAEIDKAEPSTPVAPPFSEHPTGRRRFDFRCLDAALQTFRTCPDI